jgi:hypothetical protein
LGGVHIPAPPTPALMTSLHAGVLYLVVRVAALGCPGSLAALRLPGL